MPTKIRITAIALVAAFTVGVAGAPAADARKDTGAYDRSAEKLNNYDDCQFWKEVHAANKEWYKNAKKAPFNRKKKVKRAKAAMRDSRRMMEAACR